MQNALQHLGHLKKQLGMTLLEIMLVLAVGAMFIIIGLQQYSQWSEQSSADQLKYNVDSLFQAMAYFYKANCADSYDQNGNPVAKSGALSPSSFAAASLAFPPTNPFPVTVSTLETNGYLKQWQPVNPLVNTSSTAIPYIVQFNPITENYNVYACWNFNPGMTTSHQKCTIPQPIPTSASAPYGANVVLWSIQVAVLIQDTANINTYKNQLIADCISTTSGNTIIPCGQTGSGTGAYLVWTRMPSFANPTIATSANQAAQNLKAFQLQYTHDPMYELNNVTYAGQQYYLCGG